MDERVDSLTVAIGLEFLEPDLVDDIEQSLLEARELGVRMPFGETPSDVFGGYLSAAMKAISGNPRGELIQRFLRLGPYWAPGRIPKRHAGDVISDADTAAAVRFISGHMVNSFQGALAEMLAMGPVARLVDRFVSGGMLPVDCEVHAGDRAVVARPGARNRLKGADFHLLGDVRSGSPELIGVGEVKSYRPSSAALDHQLARHVERAVSGLALGTGPLHEIVTPRLESEPILIAVLPASWRLSRWFELAPGERGPTLRFAPVVPPSDREHFAFVDGIWRITLRWSHEALASAAYGMTFWYMEKAGEVVYSEGVPREWSEMTPGEAGVNAAKEHLYWAIMRARSWREEQRAIALYNTYGFGYSLGRAFRDSEGAHEMLWFEDLKEIAATGRTKTGCRIHGYSPSPVSGQTSS